MKSKFVADFFVLFVFLALLYKYLGVKKLLMILRYIKKRRLKFWYLKGYKWLLSQKQRVRSGFFGYRQYSTLTKRIKPLKVIGRQCPDYTDS